MGRKKKLCNDELLLYMFVISFKIDKIVMEMKYTWIACTKKLLYTYIHIYISQIHRSTSGKEYMLQKVTIKAIQKFALIR